MVLLIGLHHDVERWAAAFREDTVDGLRAGRRVLRADVALAGARNEDPSDAAAAGTIEGVRDAEVVVDIL